MPRHRDPHGELLCAGRGGDRRRDHRDLSAAPPQPVRAQPAFWLSRAMVSGKHELNESSPGAASAGSAAAPQARRPISLTTFASPLVIDCSRRLDLLAFTVQKGSPTAPRRVPARTATAVEFVNGANSPMTALQRPGSSRHRAEAVRRLLLTVNRADRGLRGADRSQGGYAML